MNDNKERNYSIKVRNVEGLKKNITCPENENLLRVLQKHNFDVYAPCGGNGTCGKCQVNIKGEGIVTSCKYAVDHNIELILPEKKELNILTAQHDYCYAIDSQSDTQNSTQSDFGLAVDIGTTTLAFYYINLSSGAILEIGSCINPQTRYGADIISRIQFCNREETKIKELQECIVDTINTQIELFSNQFDASPNKISIISVAGNPTMLHLLLRIDPMPIALAPFTPAFLDAQEFPAKEIGICSHNNTKLKTLPSISAYVGADIVAGIATIKPDKKFKNYLFLDIGTNGEMALITPEKIYCCATAAGPAFEGGNISCGMGAFPGAVSEVNEHGKFKTIDSESPIGICGSGLIDLISYLVKQKIINTEGNLEQDYTLPSNGKNEKEISINQNDIREVQLAKSAIIAGIKILMSTSKLDFSQIDALFLAGGFGNYINIESASHIGLLPSELKTKAIPIGNTSISGAYLSLKSEAFNERLKEIIEKSEYIELSTHDDFVMEYAMNMYF